jgi:hypothetical protein
MWFLGLQSKANQAFIKTGTPHATRPAWDAPNYGHIELLRVYVLGEGETTPTAAEHNDTRLVARL